MYKVCAKQITRMAVSYTRRYAIYAPGVNITTATGYQILQTMLHKIYLMLIQITATSCLLILCSKSDGCSSYLLIVNYCATVLGACK